MGNKIIKFLLKFILPVIIIFILFRYNALYGLGALVLAIGYLLVTRQASIFAFLGTQTYSKGNFEEGLKWFQRSYATGKANPQAITSYAYLLLKNGNIAESEEILTKLVKSHLDKDSEMYAKSNLALVLWKKGEIDNAIEMLETIMQDYKTTSIYGSLGYLLIEKGDMEKALQFNLEAYEYNNSNTIIQDNLGQVYHLTNQYDKSLEIYEKCMEKNPTFPSAYYNYGSLLMDMGQLEKAKEMLEKALTYKLTYLSTISREEIEGKLEEITKLT